MNNTNSNPYFWWTVTNHISPNILPRWSTFPGTEIPDLSDKMDDFMDWRVSDADGEIYAHGRYYADGLDINVFSPLDDYFTAAYGAVKIEYFNPENGEWEIPFSHEEWGL